MKLSFIIFLVLAGHTAGAQLNVTLKKQLDSVMSVDQQYRQLLGQLTSKEKVDSVAKAFNKPPGELINYLSQLQNKVDTTNLMFIESVIRQYGYPGKTLVGPETSEVAWFIIQHSGKIGEYLPVIRKAGKKGDLKKTHIAMMEDRYLMYNGKEQIYGTQGAYRTLKSGVSETIIWPIRNAKRVDKRRKKIGFSTTIEEYANKLNIIYRQIKLTDIID